MDNGIFLDGSYGHGYALENGEYGAEMAYGNEAAGGYMEYPVVEGAEYSEDGYGAQYQDPNNEFHPINHVIGDGGTGINALAFDQYEEMLWMGNQTGHVTSYYSASLNKYTSFQVHESECIRGLHTNDQGVLALSQTHLLYRNRRGLRIFDHTSNNMTDMQCMIEIPQRPNQLLMGGIQEKIVSLDLEKRKEIQLLDTGGSCAVMRYNTQYSEGRYLGCGDTSGKIDLRDPANMQVCHTLETHSGTLSDFDMHGNHLVTCGFARRHGNHQAVDRFLLVYDLRILRAINPIQCFIEPCQLRFLSGVTGSRIVVMSSAGQVQIVDTAEVSNAKLDIFQLDTGGSMALSFGISPSNNCLAFGDEACNISLFSSVAEPVFNMYSRETVFPNILPTFAPISLSDPLMCLSAIPLPHLPPDQTQYASDNWPQRALRPKYRPVPEIDPELLKSMKMVGTIGYAPNIGNKKRNVMILNDRRHNDRDKSEMDPNSAADENSAYRSSVPKRYRKTDIKLGKMGLDDFDFDTYNKTSFCGLEASLPNSYCNAMLQILYFTEKLRLIMLNHFCNRESCLACELSFLFHMLDTGSLTSQGLPCQAANFLRALRTMPEASALGLIFTESNSLTRGAAPRVIQSWNRFLLQQIHQQTSTLGPGSNSRAQTPLKTPAVAEVAAQSWSRSSPVKNGRTPDPASKEDIANMADTLSAGPSGTQPDNALGKKQRQTEDEESPVALLLGMHQDKITKCTRCNTRKSSDHNMLLCNLMYPDQGPSNKQKISFGQVLCSSLCPEQVTPAWCDKCQKYMSTSQSRRLRNLPNAMSLNAGMDNPADIAFWNSQMNLILEEEGGGDAAAAASSADKGKKGAAATASGSEVVEDKEATGPPPGQKMCRFGTGCNRRTDCKYWHYGQEGAKEPPLDVADRLAGINRSWVPFKITLYLTKHGTVHHKKDKLKAADIVETKDYSLYAVCCNILDPVSPDVTNLVSMIKVGPEYHSRIGSPVSQWYIFNDFTINAIPAEEAVWFNLKWKIPCIIFFQADTMPTTLKELSYKNPITVDVFNEDKNLNQKAGGKITFRPLSMEEIPKKGNLVAIDAEFVTLNQEEAELRSDGKFNTVKAAQMSVARITCVRGEGPLESVPFIDDYISTQEQVVDYLTKFSGIKPGDLDANFSSKHLTTLKSTYQKLRYLVDLGVFFVGHGLKNDFRVINLVVPGDQLVDTLYLYHLPHHRYVSLKFLAWHFLGMAIQGTTHDSIEDAITSLRLYKKYLEIKKEGKIMEALTGMYKTGKELNWCVPSDPALHELNLGHADHATVNYRP